MIYYTYDYNLQFKCMRLFILINYSFTFLGKFNLFKNTEKSQDII